MILFGGYDKQFSALYDFTADSSAGAIGTINLGWHFPKFCWITSFWVAELVNVTSGGAATISFGLITTDITPAVSTVNNLMTAQAIANFVAQPLLGVDLNAAPLRILNTSDLTMSIATAALTAGKLLIGGTYMEFLQ